MTQQKQQFTILGITVAIAIIAVLIAIFISNSQSATSTDVDFNDIPQERLGDGGFILGDPSAPIIIVEFADFLCPHCQNYKPTINRIIEEFVANGQARLEFRMLPTQTGSDNLFRLAECIDDTDEGSFWQAHDEFFTLAINNTDRNDIGRIAAENLGVPYAEILQCADDLTRNNSGQYLTDRSLASPVGVTGTPAIRVRLGGSDAPMQAISNSLPSFDTIKEAVLAANTQAQ
jgi:protein-disulfide isomerase